MSNHIFVLAGLMALHDNADNSGKHHQHHERKHDPHNVGPFRILCFFFLVHLYHPVRNPSNSEIGYTLNVSQSLTVLEKKITAKIVAIINADQGVQ